MLRVILPSHLNKRVEIARSKVHRGILKIFFARDPSIVYASVYKRMWTVRFLNCGLNIEGFKSTFYLCKANDGENSTFQLIMTLSQPQVSSPGVGVSSQAAAATTRLCEARSLRERRASLFPLVS